MKQEQAAAHYGSQWRVSLVDPVRENLRRRGEQPDLERIRSLFPPTTGTPAFDPRLIEANIERLETVPKVDTGHPFLDLSVKVGLASIDATFQGDHPKYGVTGYAGSYHDGFPPTIIAATDALSGWGIAGRAARLFAYWLAHFVRDDGSIKYGGTSLAERGQLLDIAATLDERIGPEGWWEDGHTRLDSMAEWLLRSIWEAENDGGLLFGVPEDDEKHNPGRYFHNQAWVAKGLRRWAELCERRHCPSTTPVTAVRHLSESLSVRTLQAIEASWPTDASDWWLPPRVEPLPRPESLTGTRDASYTNYRYWPELLSSDILPLAMAERLVNARLSGGGQFCGMTRFSDCLDDWPLADYLYGLWRLGRKDDFLLSLYGHIAYHQAEGHLTAYESVTFPPGEEHAPYCLPAQLVAARAARLLMAVRG